MVSFNFAVYPVTQKKLLEVIIKCENVQKLFFFGGSALYF